MLKLKNLLLLAVCAVLPFAMPLAADDTEAEPNPETEESRLPEYRIYQLPCGNEVGDAYLFASPDGKFFLLDGGHQKNYLRTLKPEFERLGVTRLESIIISHWHDDHIYAVFELLKDMENSQIEVGQILWQDEISWEAFEADEPKWFKGNQILVWNFKAEAKKRGVPIRAVKNGTKIDLGGGAYGEVLWGNDLEHAGRNYMNNQSMLMKFHYGKNTVLFTGDMGFEEEYHSLRAGVDFKADVLKAPHHGGGGSNSYVLLKGCAPKFAIISQPKEILELSGVIDANKRFAACGIPIFPAWQYPRLYLSTDGVDIFPCQDGENLLKK